jgi:AcrR family transcriptional regulator
MRRVARSSSSRALESDNLTPSTARFTQQPNVSQHRQGRGRPRDPDVERRTLEVARLIYGESGKSQVTFANVAARAGVGKPALYRRWQNPEQLLMDALRHIPLPPGIEDLGDAQAELAGYARDLMRLYMSSDGAAMLRLTTEFHDETKPFRQLIARVSEGMVGLAATVLDRAARRGEPPPDMPAEAIMETLTGTMLSHIMVRRRTGQLPPEDEVARYCWRLAGLVLGRAETGTPQSARPAEPRRSASREIPRAGQRLPRPASRRDELIRIAQHVAARQGFADVTLAQVAESAGLTAPAIYTHFSSRTDLLEQVLETTAREYAADIRSTDDATVSVEERLRIRLSRWAITPSSRLRILHDAVLHIPESARVKRAVERSRGAWVNFVVDVLERGIARGEVRADIDVDAATELLTSSLLGVEVATETGLAGESLLALTDQLVDMFLAYLRSPRLSPASRSESIDGRTASELRSS